jgi:hypothetical protein
MNPVGAEGNIFSSLFDKVPAKRAAKAEDIAGTVMYLVSKAGVSVKLHHQRYYNINNANNTLLSRPT